MKDMNARLMDIVEDENLSWNKLLVNSKDKFLSSIISMSCPTILFIKILYILVKLIQNS